MRKHQHLRLKGAFAYCPWCAGSGCLACDEERRKYEERMAQPIFSADVNDPEDMAALRRVIGREALEQAFGPDGGGAAEIEYRAAVESVLQALRRASKSRQEAPSSPGGGAAPTSPDVAKEAEC